METVNSDIIMVYLLGTVGMLLLAGSLFFFFLTYQKRILKKQIELNKVKSEEQEKILRNTVSAQEKERKRIAQDLHDEVGAMLSVVKLNVGRIEKKTVEPDAKDLAVETRNYLDDVILQVRRISRALLPPSLEKLGFSYAIEELVNWINKTDQVEIEYWKGGDQIRLDIQKETAVFRIVQELLNNSLKHSGANKITIKVKFGNKRIALSVSDNGKGFSVEERLNSGLGLKNLESRTQIINAGLKIKSFPGKGTCTIICLNLED